MGAVVFMFSVPQSKMMGEVVGWTEYTLKGGMML